MVTPLNLVSTFENYYRYDIDHEHALLLDASGNLIAERSGTDDKVEFDTREFKRACMGLLSHNHPKGLPPSKSDLMRAAEYGLTLRAVGKSPDNEDNEYTVRFPVPSTEIAQAIGRQYDDEVERAEKEFSKKSWTAWKWERESRHKAVMNLAKRYKFAYKRVRHGAVSEVNTHEASRLKVLSSVEEKMRADVLSPLGASIASLLARHADDTGAIPLSSIEVVRRSMDVLIQRSILGAPQADGLLMPFSVKHGDVISHSVYFKTLWLLMREAAEKAINEHAAIMRKYLPVDLQHLFELASINPFTQPVSEAKDDLELIYDPLHKWLGDDGKQLSDRIWNVAGDMRRKLDEYLAHAIATHTPVQKMAKELEQFLVKGRGSYEALRLARTETASAFARASSLSAQLNPFVETYTFLTAPSHQCCDICDEVQSASPYPKSDTKHLPPQHPECICRIVWNIVKDISSVVNAIREQIKRALEDATKSIADIIGPLSKRFLDLLFRGK